MKRSGLLAGLLSITAAITFQGCGGGDSSSSVGKAYYVDAAVEGVAYKCGSQEGVTGKKGDFNFEVGAGCEFYIGHYKFKELSSAQLKDGAIIVENDTKIAAILQTLDADGNPDNNITIHHSVAIAAGEVLAKEHTHIHTDLDSVLEDIVVHINTDPKAEQKYHGHIIDEQLAKIHLEKTKACLKAQEEAKKHKEEAEKEAQEHKQKAEEEALKHKNEAQKEAQEHKQKAEEEALKHKNEVQKEAQNATDIAFR